MADQLVLPSSCHSCLLPFLTDLAGALPYQPACNPPSLFPGKLMQTGGTGLILKWNFGDESFSGKDGAEDIIICGKYNVANTWHANEVKTLQLLPGMN